MAPGSGGPSVEGGESGSMVERLGGGTCSCVRVAVRAPGKMMVAIIAAQAGPEKMAEAVWWRWRGWGVAKMAVAKMALLLTRRMGDNEGRCTDGAEGGAIEQGRLKSWVKGGSTGRMTGMAVTAVVTAWCGTASRRCGQLDMGQSKACGSNGSR